jgi:hypothetical protein
MSTRLALRCALLAAALFVACSSERRDPAPSARLNEPEPGSETASRPSPPALTQSGAALPFVATKQGFQTHTSSYVASVSPLGALGFRSRDAEPALQLETVTAGRERQRTEPKLARLGPEAQVLIRRQEFEEEFRATELGVEHAWRFARRPEGAGDYVLRVAVSGLGYRGKTRDGHHFGLGGDHPGLRYGVATFIDAKNVATRVDVDYDEGALVLRLPADLLERAEFPAILDPLLGVETTLELGPAVLGGRPGANGNPAGAFNGTHFLAAYEQDEGQPVGIQITRTTANGNVVDGAGRRIGTGFTPTVATDGKDFLVSYFARSLTDNARFNVMAQRVSAAGTAVGTPLTLATNAVQGATRAGAGGLGVYAVQPGKMATAYGGGTYLVVYETDTGIVYGQRVSSAGSASPAFALTSGMGTKKSPAVAFNGTHFLAAWQDSRANQAISAARIAPDGTVLEPLSIAVSNSGSAPQVASDGVDFAIAWHRVPNFYSATIHAARVTAAGAVLDNPAITIPTVNGALTAGVTIAWDGVSYVLAWQAGDEPSRNVVGARLGTSGAVLDAAAFAILSGSFEPRAAPGPAGTTAIFARSGNYWTSAANVAPVAAGAVTPPGPFPVSVVATSHLAVAPVTTATGQLVAWSKSNGAIAGTRLSDSGAALDTPRSALIGLDVAPGGWLVPKTVKASMALASDGVNFIMATTEVSPFSQFPSNNAVQLARFDAQGTALGPPFSITAPQSEGAAVAFDGVEYLVVWSDKRNGTESDIYGVRVKPDGAFLDTVPITICAATKNQITPVVASNGNGFLVAWDDPRSGLGTDPSDIYGARIARDGTVLDPNGLAISTANVGQHAPTLAFDGTDYVVAWEDGRNDALSPDIYAARVSPQGVVVDKKGVALSTAAGPQRKPTIAPTGDGQTLLVAWQDARLGQSDIRGTWLAPGLRVLDTDGVILAGGEGDHLAPRLGSGRGGRNVLGYGHVSPFAGTPQATVRMLEAGLGAGKACTSSDACALRFCADGFCCEEACDKACRTCGATPGKCTSVAQAEDPGTCSGANSCNAAGECAKKLGNACARGTDCASGFCTDGVCCDSACSGGCDVCNVVPGKCTIVPAGDTGANPSCLPGVCDGRSAQCTATCNSDTQCSPGTYCASDGQCRAACANDTECPKGAACDVATRRCIARARCVDDRTLEAQETRTSCAPYRCSEAACGTRCTSVADCASPAACDADGRCVLPTADPPASGCRQSQGRTPGFTDVGLFGLALGLTLRRRRKSAATGAPG